MNKKILLIFAKGLIIKVQKNMKLMLRLPVYLVLTGGISTNKMLQRIYATAFIVKKILINI